MEDGKNEDGEWRMEGREQSVVDINLLQRSNILVVVIENQVLIRSSGAVLF
jgi:hypothetical protein